MEVEGGGSSGMGGGRRGEVVGWGGGRRGVAVGWRGESRGRKRCMEWWEKVEGEGQ